MSNLSALQQAYTSTHTRFGVVLLKPPKNQAALSAGADYAADPNCWNCACRELRVRQSVVPAIRRDLLAVVKSQA